MPSGTSINWAKYDDIIRAELPLTTIQKLARKLALHPKPLGVRAKLLGVRPAKFGMTAEQKSKLSKIVGKELTITQQTYIQSNYLTHAAKQMARDLGVSYHLVKKTMKELNLRTPAVVREQSMLAGAAKRGALGAAALRKRLTEDSDFAAQLKIKGSERSKRLWCDEIYRLKVRNGIRTTYADTDLKDRLSKMGKERYLSDPAIKAILAAPRPFKTSKLNDDVALVLDGFGIHHEREFEVSNYKFDFRVDDILLEVNGEYWHNLPNGMRNDRAKATLVQLYYPQYQIRTIWEREFRAARGKERLLEILGRTTKEPTVIKLPDVTLGPATVLDINRFLSGFHYLGASNRCRYGFGAYLHGELIAVAAFGPMVRQNISKLKSIELVRLCRHPYFYNYNLLSKFLSWCCREIRILKKYEQIISYADTTLHEGTIYRACNWTDDGLCQPDYQYMSSGGVPMHKKTLYNRAKAAAMSEREYAELNRYKKIYAGQKRRFTLSLQ